jgi:putative hydrolase of the HAD superfamily
MRAFLFDLDDTLFDHRHSTRTALAVIRERLPSLAALAADALEEQHAVVLEELHQRVLTGHMDVDAARRERFKRLVNMQGADVTAQEIEEASRAYRAAYVAARRAVTGAVQLLETLHPYGRIEIVSNNVIAEQVEKAAVCGIDRHVDALVVSEAVGVAKPDPAIFHIALERIGAHAADGLMIGDSWNADIAGARAAGLRAVWFNPLRRPCPDAALISAQIHSWEPAPDVVERILSCGSQDQGQGLPEP